MKTIFLIFAAVCLSITSGAAAAGDRYGKRPPIVLSPDLSAPWVTQLRQPGSVHGAGKVVSRKRVQRRAAFSRKKARRTVSVKRRDQARAQTMNPVFLPQVVSYPSSQKVGTIIIDTPNRFLYLVLGNGQARRYGVGVGKPGFEWAGTHRVSRKREWPDWRPPAEMIAREKRKGRNLPTYMAGGPANPLGARALYLGSTPKALPINVKLFSVPP